MQNWRKEFNSTGMVMHALYGAIFIYIAVMYLVPVPAHPSSIQNTIFMILMILGLSSFPISFFIAGQIMSMEQLEKIRREYNGEKRLEEAVSSVRAGTLIMAALGEAYGLYGLVFYFLSGDRVRPWFLFAGALIHYFLTAKILEASHRQIKELWTLSL